MTLQYTPRPQFLPFHNRKQRWAVLNTHRRAGKTVALVNDVVVGALECPLHRPQLAYVGPTFTQAKRIAWQYMKDYAAPYLAKAPSESELKLTLVNDASIYCLGADNPDSLRGMYLDGTAMDEYAMFRPSVFSQIIRPALSDRNGWAVFTSTPKGKNLFYKVVQQALKDPTNWFHMELRASISGIIPLNELLALQKDMDPEEFAQEYECSFDAALKGAIYASEVNQLFAENRIITSGDLSTGPNATDAYKPLLDPSLPTHVVFDLGFTDAMVGLFWQEPPSINKPINIVRCYASTGQDIMHYIEDIEAFAARGDVELGDVWLPHDARAKNLQTGRSIVEQFLDSGIRPRIVPPHKVRDGIAAGRKMFPRVVIDDPACGEFVEALKAYRREWSDEYNMFVDKPVHDWASHYADAYRYLAVVASKSVFRSPVGPGSENVHPASDFHLEGLWSDHDRRRAPARRIA